MMDVRRIVWAWVLCGWVVLAAPAAAQRAGDLPPAFEGVGIEERLGEHVPAGLTFLDETGAEVRLGDYLGGERPVALNLVYFDCPMLCSLVLDRFTQTLRQMTWTPGEQFEVLTVSFAAGETPDLAARAKARYLSALGRPEAARGWHFLTGTEENIRALAAAVGFSFKWVEEAGEYAHPTALILLGGDGKITRYLHGMDYPAADVRKALVEASEGKVGTTLDRVLLYCFRYDPEANSYVPHAVNLMKLGGLLTVVVLALMLFVFWRRERARLHQAEAGGPGEHAYVR
ncbi:SCO family protein [Rhodocaloribacter litoris]|uniref:SCO family protein n=1 Tax=Rhodocaloribacter litoris TaxID=2558931 RepID=UPI001E58BC62|nr:SCO family protein [Rhodocaloribacter litoris]